MPIWLRKFTFETIREYNEKQNEEINKQNNLMKNTGNSASNVAKPNVPNPSYAVKTPKK